VFGYEYIKSIIRILSRLKLNSLHLHLYDDQINSVRFEKLPLGHENPFALTIPEYGEIIRYAGTYGISVVPEFESWGHAGSIVYHYPELQGVPGMYDENLSFPIGSRTFALLEQMYDEFFPVIADGSQFHLGLDEASWVFDPNETQDRGSFDTPEKMVEKLHAILVRLGEKHGKEVTMRIWADHKGRPVPEKIKDQIIIEPWNYWEGGGKKVDEDLKKYGGLGQMRMMMGGGMSAAQPQGEYIATGMWCKKAMNLDNVEGVNITVWGTNNIPDVLIGIYVGANYAWSPEAVPEVSENLPHDKHRGIYLRLMKDWQGYFKDADRDMLLRQRGPEVFNGRFVGTDKHNIPVSPTTEFLQAFNKSRGHHDPFEALEKELSVICEKH
ncbi:MAG: family 20 glycosylhydrolase, partial [Victivallales bacterium]|nr:family 20 glycosylhydrolase [Victivallales bacterium]